jgi:hypothetical protein
LHPPISLTLLPTWVARAAVRVAAGGCLLCSRLESLGLATLTYGYDIYTSGCCGGQWVNEIYYGFGRK